MSLVIADEGPFIKVDHINFKNRIEKIPGGVYKVGVVDEEPVLVKDREKFDLPKRIYGKHEAYKATVVRKFRETKGTLGVLMDGLKGTGKSLLAEGICNKLIESGMPILLVSDSVSPSLLKHFIEAMGPCAIYFDEFGKFYKEEARDKMLTLFSDSSLKQVMFIVTSNHTGELTDAMIHRPGRFFYKFNYKGLEEEEILEIIEDNKIEPAVLAYMLDYCKYHQCSFDVVRVLISCAFNMPTVEKYIEELKIHNVPNQVYTQYRVSEVMYKGEKYEGDITVSEENGTLKIALRDKVTTVVVEEVTFEWTSADKVPLGKSGNEFRIKLSDTLTIKIDRSVSSWKANGVMLDIPMKFDATAGGGRRKRHRGFGDDVDDYPRGHPLNGDHD